VFAGAAPAQPGSNRVQQGRSILLRVFAAVAGHDLSYWEQLLSEECSRLSLTLHWRGALYDTPSVAAVRVAHALELGPAGLQAWHAAWTDEWSSPPLRLVARAASLLSGHEAMLILAATGAGRGGDAGALIDGESCARMAAAGLDPRSEIQLGHCAELLASSGDLLNLPAVAGAGGEPSTFLILGLKWHAPAGD
jgi:hypothetical protein